MMTNQPQPPKPKSEIYDPDIIRLPELTWSRKLFRKFMQIICRIAVFITAQSTVTGVENFPKKGPALVVTNHLGDADAIVSGGFLPIPVDAVAKSELLYMKYVGFLLESYGVVWVHRGRPDRKALKEVLRGLKEGRFFAIAPEGRESLTGALEKGTNGAAYIALKADVPIVPLTYTGTENSVIFGNLKKFKRSTISMTVGKPFRLTSTGKMREDIENGTTEIMVKLAKLLPEKYRGYYSSLAT